MVKYLKKAQEEIENKMAENQKTCVSTGFSWRVM
jgi:hypothetical protein